MLKCLRSWWMAGLVLAAPALVYGQATSQGTINTSGGTEITHPATAMRMQVEVIAEGKTIQDALAALKTRCETLRGQLGQLGASAQNIKFGEPHIYQNMSEQARRMEMMMRARMNGGGKVAKGKPAPPVQVACTNTTEWDLKGSSDERLIQSHELKTKVEEAMKPAPKAADAAAEEEAEEQGMQQQGYDDGSPKPGQPMVVYVTRISPEERTKALATVLEKSKQQATQIAAAAGVQLGAIQSISQSMRPNLNAMNYRGGMNQYMYQMMAVNENGEPSSDDEVIGPDASAVKLNVTIAVTWAITK